MRVSTFIPWLLLLALTGCSQLKESTHQPGRFYTWMDAEGRLHTQALPSAPAAMQAQAGVPTAPPPAGVPSVVVPSVAPAQKLPDDRPDLFAPDSDFVDSAVLEAHHFNMETKKKFGVMTDASGRSYPVYFAQGEGGLHQEDTLAAPAVTANVAAAVERGGDSWPTLVTLPENCCAGLFGAVGTPPALIAKHSYRVSLPTADCVVTGACKALVFALPTHVQARMLRLYSYMNGGAHCKSCLQWPVVVVLDRNYQPRRAYVADLGGYRAESWYAYASFHFDFNISATDDAYLMLVQSSRALTYKNKQYQGSDKGEIAFALIP